MKTCTSILALLLATALIAAVGCQSTSDGKSEDDTKVTEQPSEAASKPAEEAASRPAEGDRNGYPTESMAPEGKGIATFAGGCFWCMEAPFEAIDGVDAVYSGYTAGPEVRPTYKQVGGGATGHTEAVRVIYDKDKVSFELLAKVFWRNINPTQKDGQFVDHGRQYRTGIYTHDAEQKKIAEATKAEAQKKFDDPIVTEIEDFESFYPAENYHQDFYLKSTDHYSRYRNGSGRDAYLKKVWGEEAGGYKLHGGEKKH